MTVMISYVTLVIVGTLFINAKIEKSQQLQCGVLQVSLMPRPKPPANPNEQPETPYGKALQRYTQQQEAISAQGRVELQRLTKKYHCPERKSS